MWDYNVQTAQDARSACRADVQVVFRSRQVSARALQSEIFRHNASFLFNTCVRQEGESITAYVTRLRDLAYHCEYGDSAKDLIRDRLVCGVRDDTLQRTLLAVAKLTFDRAFELALLHESAAQNARLLSNPSSTAPVHFADPSLPGDSTSVKSCYRCGGSHYAKDCRFKDTVCNYCRKKGHLQRVCRSRFRQHQSRNS